MEAIMALTPPFRSILGHDVEMSAKRVLVRYRAPLFVAVGGAQVGDHDRDLVTSSCTFALTGASDGTHVGELVAGPAARPAPAPRASEEILTASCGVDFGSWVVLPRGHAFPGTTTTCAFLTIEIMLDISVSDMNSIQRSVPTVVVAMLVLSPL